MSNHEDGHHDTANDAHDDPLAPALPVESDDSNGDVGDEESEIRRMHAELMATIERIPETFETNLDIDRVNVHVSANLGRPTHAQLEEVSRQAYGLCQQLVAIKKKEANNLEMERETARLELELEAVREKHKAAEAESKALKAQIDRHAALAAVYARVSRQACTPPPDRLE